VEKEWEERRKGEASTTSDEAETKGRAAYEQSKTADDKDNPTQHLAAERMHKEAAEAHDKASKSAYAAGDSTGGNAHARERDIHNAAAESHDHLAESARGPAASEAEQKAYNASSSALAASGDADKSNTSDAHSTAAEAHEDAASQHHFIGGDTHNTMGVLHKQMAAGHAAKVKKSVRARGVVKAAGTSDGAVAGHLSRKSNRAVDLSSAAHEASAKAFDSQDPADHRAAADAHGQAHGAHEEAYKAHLKAGSPEADTDQHMAGMKSHAALQEQHEGLAGGEAQAETTKCAGCGEEFDYGGEPESSMGAVKCPGCGAAVNQEGDKVSAANPTGINQYTRNDGSKKYDDIGTGKYDKLGTNDRLKIHADKAEEFEKAGDKFNAVQHAKAAVRMASKTGQLGSEEHLRAEGVHKRLEGYNVEPDYVKSSGGTNSDVVQCRNVGSPLPDQDVPEEIMWMPAGVTTIQATWNRRPIDLTVECDEGTADVVQASFEDWLDRYPKQKPYLDVDHHEEEAAAWPSGFRSREDPEPGVFCRIGVWSQIGKQHVAGRNYRSFSPSFRTSAEYHKAVCQGCGHASVKCNCPAGREGMLVFPEGAVGSPGSPARITGVAFPVGSLTNMPAFKNILPVKAKQAGAGGAAVLAVYGDGDVVNAGDYPGHPFHGNQYAEGKAGSEESEQSHKAHIASQIAKTASEHRAAAKEHLKAAKLQEEAGNETTADYHRAMAGFHQKAASKGGTMKACGDYNMFAPVMATKVVRYVKPHRVWNAGEEQEVSAAQADELISGGVAVLASSPKVSPPTGGQAEPQPETRSAEVRGQTMKLKVVKARGSFTAGQVVDVETGEAAKMLDSGDAVTAREAELADARDAEVKKLKDEAKAKDEGAVKTAVVRAKAREAVPPKDEEVQARSLKWLGEGAPVDMVVTQIDAMPGVDMTVAARRHVAALAADSDGRGGDWFHAERLDKFDGFSVRNTCENVVQARRPMDSLCKGGMKGIIEAAKIARETAQMLRPIMAMHDLRIADAVRPGTDDAVRAADYTDPSNQVGILSGTLVMMRNLGFLKNKLNFLPWISTDLRGEPILYGQTAMTRYITPPNELVFVQGYGYTSLASITTPSSSALPVINTSQTFSTPAVTDAPVTINRNFAVEVTFPTSVLGATVRNLFAEQQSAQLYSLAERITKDFLTTVFTTTWSPAATSAAGYALGGSAFALPGVVGLKTQFTMNKLPDIGRFVLLHTAYHDQILRDSNLLTAKMIMALVNKNATAFTDGELPPLFGLQILESQLAAWNAATAIPTGAINGWVSNGGTATSTPSPTTGALASVTDPTQISTQAPNGVGFAGTSASMLFAARVPQDYADTASKMGVPSTAAIEVVTEPDAGLSMMLVKYVNHTQAAVYARCAMMWGFQKGDPRQGFILLP